MKTLGKTSRIHYSGYFFVSGFQVFKERLREELITSKGIHLDYYADDETLYSYYLQGESIPYMLDALCGEEGDFH
ncbi:MAG: hypothetical protein LBR60_00165 [Fibrobacter sp.]|jgi:hypothetical protein|nr:hypothetical protein [Fibrobacter sp.]